MKRSSWRSVTGSEQKQERSWLCPSGPSSRGQKGGNTRCPAQNTCHVPRPRGMASFPPQLSAARRDLWPLSPEGGKPVWRESTRVCRGARCCAPAWMPHSGSSYCLSPRQKSLYRELMHQGLSCHFFKASMCFLTYLNVHLKNEVIYFNK